MREQRSAERFATFILGTMLFEHSVSTCLIGDMSASGARLRVSASKWLPDHFDLYLPRYGTTHRVELRWRKDDEAGVAFQSSDRIPGVPMRFGIDADPETPTASGRARPAARRSA
ncbi:MAG TPA: PilZ domain-containing protein [Microvirga sp.]|nr:PilZ domain-containing protein [Microvirga sp.]